MPTFIQHREHKSEPRHDLCYDYKGHKRWGYAFPCDQKGKVNLEQFAPEAIKSLAHCICHSELFDRYVDHYAHDYTEYAVILCEDCNQQVTLDVDNGMGIECDCGAIYNLSGQRLAPRSQWDEYLAPDDCHMVSEYYGGYEH